MDMFAFIEYKELTRAWINAQPHCGRGQIKWRIEWTNEEVAKNSVQSKKWLLSQAEIKVLHEYVDLELADRKAKRDAAKAASQWLSGVRTHP